VGLQAQSPQSPYVGLWSRVAAFDPEELSAMVSDRRAVRLALLRATVHVATAGDALAIRPLVQPRFERLAGADVDEVVAAGRALLEAQPRTMADLGRALAERWPDRDPVQLAHAVHYGAALVQLPPRGQWRRSGRAVCTTLEAWLGRSQGAMPPEELVLRYLCAFGPATPADVAKWSGLTGTRAILDRMQLRHLDGGLYDAPGAPLPDPGTPAPPRFLPDFDNVLLSHADRSRIAGELPTNVIGRPTFLVDGFVAGFWKLDGATLRVEPFDRLRREDRRALREEATALAAFLGAKAVELA
jgi:Winged helix DNA-binding domain